MEGPRMCDVIRGGDVWAKTFEGDTVSRVCSVDLREVVEALHQLAQAGGHGNAAVLELGLTVLAEGRLLLGQPEGV